MYRIATNASDLTSLDYPTICQVSPDVIDPYVVTPLGMEAVVDDEFLPLVARGNGLVGSW